MSNRDLRSPEWRRAPAVLLCAFIPIQAWGQPRPAPPPVTIANTERQELRSGINGVTYQIDVALPRTYPSSQKRYPVVYLLDGNVFFPLLATSYRLVAGLLPDELIIVGVGYPSNEYGFWSRPYGANRGRDYTPTKPSSGIGTEGGAPAFLRFLRDELIPFVDATYRTVPGDRGLIGHSYGGLFAAYALTHEPAVFQKYALGSPSLWWDNEAVLRWEAEYAAKHKELPARVCFYLGEFEDQTVMRAPARRFWDALKTRHYVGLDLIDFFVAPDEIHTSVVLGSMQHALRGLYARKAVSLPVDVLRRYTGEWIGATEHVWTIRQEGDNRLVLDIPPYKSGPLASWAPQQREILAESETSFFTKLGDIHLAFTLEPASGLAREMRIAIPLFEYSSVLLNRAPGRAASP